MPVATAPTAEEEGLGLAELDGYDFGFLVYILAVNWVSLKKHLTLKDGKPFF